MTGVLTKITGKLGHTRTGRMLHECEGSSEDAVSTSQGTPKIAGKHQNLEWPQEEPTLLAS